MARSSYLQWQQAGITNDFVFGNVMLMGNNFRDLLRAILPELHIQQVRLANRQRNITKMVETHGAVLDVYAEDDCQRTYDIEMSVRQLPGLGKRIRYYQSKMDLDSLPRGANYQDMKDSYVIFLFTQDPIGLGARRYDFHYYCDQFRSQLLPTGASIVLLNSRGKRGAVTTELQSFFDLMNGQKVDTTFGRQIMRDIQIVKNDPVKEREFMDLAVKLADERREGMNEGAEHERLKNATAFAQNMQNSGQSLAQIQHNLQDIFKGKLTKAEIDRVMQQLKG